MSENEMQSTLPKSTLSPDLNEKSTLQLQKYTKQEIDSYKPELSDVESCDITEGINSCQQGACENSPEMSVKLSENQRDLNMFASVWVKVEMNEVGENVDAILYEQDNQSPEILKPNKKKSKSQLKCEQCSYSTTYKNCIELHMLSHSTSKSFSCTICDYTTKYPTSLHRHIVVKHQSQSLECDEPKLPAYQCNHCEYKTYYKWNLNAHKRKHLDKQFKCTVLDCEYETAYRHNLQKHIKRHNDNAFYKCDKCPFMTRFEGHITRHLAKIHNEVTENMFKCEMCDFSTKIKWRMNIHKQRSRQTGVLKCPYCEFETYYMCQSKMHKVKHFNEIYKKKSSLKKVQLKGSEQEESVREEEICENDKECDRDANAPKYTLDPNCLDWNSIQVLESEDKEKPFQCHMCDYTARFKASVQRHFQRHHTGTQNRPYKCVNCDFSTKTKDQIALHNKRSKSDVSVDCNQCDFSTKFKCHYVMHQKSHYENKCPKCDYTCRQKHDLQKHFTTVHLGDGLKCQYCEYTASRKDNLLCHETIHTGVKPFKCEYCDYTSVRKCLLNSHVKRQHSDIRKGVTVVSENKIQSLRVCVENIVQLPTIE